MERTRRWLWHYIDKSGKRRIYPDRLSESEAQEKLTDPQKIEGSDTSKRSMSSRRSKKH